MRISCRSKSTVRTVVAALVLSGCSEPDNSAGSTGAGADEKLSEMYSCIPTDELAAQFGPVVFETDIDASTVRFRSPSAWRVPVEIVQMPPQDVPERNLKWVATTGQTLTGRIGWQDDATQRPDSFGVLLGMRGDLMLWAKWKCTEASILVR